MLPEISPYSLPFHFQNQRIILSQATVPQRKERTRGRRGFTKVTEKSGSKTQYDCEGRWSFGCCSSVEEHCQLKPGVLGSIPSYCLLAC